MGYKITVKKEIECKECKGLGFYTFKHNKNVDISVEYFCNKCDGKGKTWKTVDMPLSSLKTLLK